MTLLEATLIAVSACLHDSKTTKTHKKNNGKLKEQLP